MSIQPAHYLVLINGYTHNGPWYEGDTYLSYRDPYALAGCWKDYFNNEILDVTSELWKNYHFTGNTGRVSVFTTRPYSEAFHTQRLDYIDPGQQTTKMQIMNLYCTMVFVINMTNIMSIIVAIIPHGIPLMDTYLMLMILIKIFRIAPELQNSSRTTFVFQLLFRNSTCTSHYAWTVFIHSTLFIHSTRTR